MAGIVTIRIDGRGHAVEAGLVSGNRLRDLAGVADDHPFALVRDAGPGTPLSASEVVLLRGGESFVATDASEDATSGPPSPVTPEFNGSREVVVEDGKVAAEDLAKRDPEVACGRLFATVSENPSEDPNQDQHQAPDEGLHVEIAVGTTIVVQSTDSYFVVPHPEDAPDETFIDIEECTKYERPPPRWHRYRIRVDHKKFVVEKRVVSGAEVLGLVEKRPADWALNQKLRGGRRIRIEAHEEVDLAEPGVERFETVRRQAQQG